MGITKFIKLNVTVTGFASFCISLHDAKSYQRVDRAALRF